MCFPDLSASTVGNAGLFTQALGVGASAGGAYNKAQGDKIAYETQAAVARNAAQVDEWRAQDAIYRGGQGAFAQGLKTAQLEGTQRARLAANGVSLDEGSPKNILEDTRYMGTVDRNTILDNANKEAWALRVSAQNERTNADILAARASSVNPLLQAGSTLLTGAGSVASSWYRLRRPSSGSGSDE